MVSEFNPCDGSAYQTLPTLATIAKVSGKQRPVTLKIVVAPLEVVRVMVAVSSWFAVFT